MKKASMRLSTKQAWMKNIEVLAGLVILLLTACAPAPTTQATITATPAPPPTSSVAQPLEPVKLAYGAPIPFIGNLPLDVAIALDLFKQEGLDVTMTRMPRLTANSNLLSGQVDFAGEAFDPGDAHVANREARSVVSLGRLPTSSLVVSSSMKDNIKTVADLKGQKIAYGGTPGIYPFVITKAGLKPEDVKFFEGGNVAQIAEDMAKGVGDAAILFEPYTTPLLKSGKAYALVDLVSEADTTKWLGGEFQSVSLMATTDTIQNRPQTVQKMATALVKALRYMASHTAAQITAILPDEVTGKNREMYIEILQRCLPVFSKDGMMREAAIQATLDVSRAMGAIKPDQQISASTLYTNEFVIKVK